MREDKSGTTVDNNMKSRTERSLNKDQTKGIVNSDETKNLAQKLRARQTHRQCKRKKALGTHNSETETSHKQNRSFHQSGTPLNVRQTKDHNTRSAKGALPNQIVGLVQKVRSNCDNHRKHSVQNKPELRRERAETHYTES